MAPTRRKGGGQRAQSDPAGPGPEPKARPRPPAAEPKVSPRPKVTEPKVSPRPPVPEPKVGLRSKEAAPKKEENELKLTEANVKKVLGQSKGSIDEGILAEAVKERVHVIRRDLAEDAWARFQARSDLKSALIRAGFTDLARELVGESCSTCPDRTRKATEAAKAFAEEKGLKGGPTSSSSGRQVVLKSVPPWRGTEEAEEEEESRGRRRRRGDSRSPRRSRSRRRKTKKEKKRKQRKEKPERSPEKEEQEEEDRSIRGLSVPPEEKEELERPDCEASFSDSPSQKSEVAFEPAEEGQTFENFLAADILATASEAADVKPERSSPGRILYESGHQLGSGRSRRRNSCR